MVTISLRKTFRVRNHLPFHIDFSMEFDGNSVIAITGPSGVGKTSILRMVAGLLVPDNGKVQIHSNVWYDSENNINRSVQQRNLGYVFQEYALFPHMTVKQNIEFAEKNGHQLVEEYMDLTGLLPYKNHRPFALSGGQQQRVAPFFRGRELPRSTILFFNFDSSTMNIEHSFACRTCAVR